MIAGTVKPHQLLLHACRSLWLQNLQSRRGWSRHIHLRLNAVHVGRWNPDYVQPPRVSYDHELECLLGGATLIRIGDKELHCRAGEALLRPPGVPQSARVEHGPVQRICFHFDWDHTHPPSSRPMPFAYPDKEAVDWAAVKPTPAWLPMDLPLRRRFPSTAWRERLLAIPARLDELDEGLSLARLETTVTALLLELLDAAAVGDAGTGNDAAIRAAQRCIERDFAQDLSLAELAREHGMSPSHLSRSFKRVVGLSPSAYVQEQRMQRAMQLLVEGGLGVGATAAACGFTDPKYFARAFAKRWGLPPSRAAGPDKGES